MPSEIVVDCIGLEPPEPMERILSALSEARENEVVCMLIDREPVPLYHVLAQNGYRHEARSLDGGIYEIRIWLAA